MNADARLGNWSRREFSGLAVLAAARPTTAPAGAGAAVETAFSPGDGRWNIEWPGRLSQHDLVYLSPPEDPVLGLPIGNGDLGGLLWTTDRGLVLALNKCDTWDDNEPRPFGSWRPAEEENHTSLRHCGRLVIDFGCPLFDLLYQQDFEARLELASATASFRATTPFAEVAASAYASAAHSVLALRCEMRAAEAYPVRLELERWGSRTFAHWYSQVLREPRRGLDGTRADVERNRIVIRQKLRTLSFVVAAELVAEGKASTARRLHSRAAAYELAPSAKTAFTLYLTAVTSENDPDPAAAAHRILDRAMADGEPAIRRRQQADWKRFWSASMVDLPEKHLENIWHLTQYFANSSSRGAYPPHFCNGLWGWNRDFVPWNYYFHWNLQWYAWPLAAANHAELATPYFRLRAGQLPLAVEFASRKRHKPGAFYTDICDRRGYNDLGADQMRNHTPGLQIALDFWRHYLFTGDERFLRESAWPVIREVARFTAACLVEGPDGLYHVSGTSAYEGSPPFEDTITDLAMIRALLPVAVRLGVKVGHNAAELEQWQARLDRLAQFHLVELEESEHQAGSDGPVHRAGLRPGTPLASRKVFAVGRNEKGEWVRNRYAGQAEMPYYGFPDPEIAPVFPAGLIGLAQRDTELFRAAVTQLRLHPPAAPGSGEICMGWCPYLIALARLGLAEELAAEIVNVVSTWQFYPQGFGHYGPYPVYKADREERWRVNQVRDAATVAPGRPPVVFGLPTWPFRHFDNEAMPIVACAINEMLLQSYDESLRICPAVPGAWDVRFDLAVAGGFRVSAERRNGRILFVSIESRLGGPCRLVHPWPAESAACVDVSAGSSPGAIVLAEDRTGPDRVLRWETAAGHRYLLAPAQSALESWKVVGVSPERRTAPRRLKQAVLGRDRLY